MAAIALGACLLALPSAALADDNSAGVSPANIDLQRHHRDDETPDFSTQARRRFPWFVTIGVYFPTFSGDGTTNNVGGELAIGYRYATDNFDFRVSARGQAFGISDQFGNNSTINVSELSFDALFRAQQFYFGPGLSFGSVTGTTNGFTVSGQDQTVFQLTAGYDISERIFVEARWQTADVDAYKGISGNFGYRF